MGIQIDETHINTYNHTTYILHISDTEECNIILSCQYFQNINVKSINNIKRKLLDK